MSVTFPTMDELFRVSIFKSHQNDISDEFVNTYELQALNSSLSYSDVDTMVQDIVLFEKQMCRATIQFDRAVVSTWLEEPGGYDPNASVTIPLTGQGEIVSNSQDLPLEVALFVRRKVESGRQGKLFLRGYLNEADVENTSGSWTLTDPAGLDTVISTAVGDHIAQYGLLSTPTAFRFVLAGRNKAGTLHIRPVVDFLVGGAVWAKRSRRHYNRCKEQ